MVRKELWEITGGLFEDEDNARGCFRAFVPVAGPAGRDTFGHGGLFRGEVANVMSLTCRSVCRNGQPGGRIGIFVSVFAHAWEVRVQKRTSQRRNRRFLVRICTRAGAPCAETDTLASESALSCPKKRARGSSVCKNGHHGVGNSDIVSVSAHAPELRVQKRTSGSWAGRLAHVSGHSGMLLMAGAYAGGKPCYVSFVPKT